MYKDWRDTIKLWTIKIYVYLVFYRTLLCSLVIQAQDA